MKDRLRGVIIVIIDTVPMIVIDHSCQRQFQDLLVHLRNEAYVPTDKC